MPWLFETAWLTRHLRHLQRHSRWGAYPLLTRQQRCEEHKSVGPRRGAKHRFWLLFIMALDVDSQHCSTTCLNFYELRSEPGNISHSLLDYERIRPKSIGQDGWNGAPSECIMFDNFIATSIILVLSYYKPWTLHDHTLFGLLTPREPLSKYLLHLCIFRIIGSAGFQSLHI